MPLIVAVGQFSAHPKTNTIIQKCMQVFMPMSKKHFDLMYLALSEHYKDLHNHLELILYNRNFKLKENQGRGRSRIEKSGA